MLAAVRVASASVGVLPAEQPVLAAPRGAARRQDLGGPDTGFFGDFTAVTTTNVKVQGSEDGRRVLRRRAAAAEISR